MKIRTYSDLSDRNEVINLWNSVFNYDKPHNNPELSINNKIKTNDGLFFVGVSGENKIIGTVMAGYDGHRGWIYSLAVLPSERDKGIGTKLLVHAEKALSTLGCPKVNLQIMPSNRGVMEFYEKNGYTEEIRINMGKIII